MEHLKGRTIRGGAARLCAYGVRFFVRLGLLMVLARLLDPSDFGLVAMVVAVTGIFEVFATGGLSTATVQREEVSHSQLSTLFWCNVVLGAFLAVLCLVIAPLVSGFYGDPRAALVIAAVAPAFLINATGVQHLAILQRELRFVTLAGIEVTSEVAAAIIAITVALAGFGYWAVVASVIAGPIIITLGSWLTSGWRPGAPRRLGEVASMLRFGGTITLTSLVVYAAYNLQKILLGRYFGSQAVGIYGRAYELIEMPTRVINNAIGLVAFSSLARLQSMPKVFNNYFLKGYSLVVSAVFPVTVAGAVFAEDVVLVVLGPKWMEAAMVLQLLAPTMLVLGIINPLAWLLVSLGLQQRSLKLALVLSPLVLCSYVVGLPYGPRGVALAQSTLLVLWLVPHVVWCLHGTIVSARELFAAIARPALATAAAALAAASLVSVVPISTPILRLALGGGVMMAVYAFILLFVMKQSGLYLNLWHGLRSGTTLGEERLQEAGIATSS